MATKTEWRRDGVKNGSCRCIGIGKFSGDMTLAPKVGVAGKN